VNDSLELFAVNDGVESVHSRQHIANFDNNLDNSAEMQMTSLEDFGQVFPFDVLHVNTEMAIQFTRFVDGDNAGVNGGELSLQQRAETFGFEGILRTQIRAVFDQLQCHLAILYGVARQVHIGHAASAQFLDNFVFA
jgi:hypothetical protein